MKKNQNSTPAAPLPMPAPEVKVADNLRKPTNIKADDLLEFTPASVAADMKPGTDTIGEAIAKTQAHIDKTAEEKLRRDREMVRGRFHYTERPGGTLKFNHFTAVGDPTGAITLVDGEMCSVMRKTARHLNNSGKKPVYGWYKDSAGLDYQRIERYEARYYFENYDVFDLDEIGPNDPLSTISKKF